MTGILVLLSGGLDSTVLLAHTVTQGPTVALSVDYGQRHHRELDAAQAVAHHYRVDHHVLDFTSWGRLLVGSSLTDATVDVPRVDYDAGSMAATVVPNRNAAFLMAAAGIAQALGLLKVATAVHAGDHAIYPDCRPEFIHAANQAALAGTGGAVQIAAPFVDMTKAEIAHLGRTLGVPFALTWSCYEGGAQHCGACGTCRERRQALHGFDPTTYTT